MTSKLPDRHRTVVPRWRTFAKARALLEMRTPIAKAQVNNSYVLERLDAFHSYRTVWHAADLLGEALLLDDKESAHEAATFIVEHRKDALPLALKTAEKVLGINEQMETQELLLAPVLVDKSVASVGTTLGAMNSDSDLAWRTQVHALRDFAMAYPRNAIAWIDTALAYTVLGSRNQAERSVRMALSLAKDNRFILRSAVRFYVHSNDLEQAQALLLKSPATRIDPWLLAAEIAVSNARKRPSKLLTVARRLTDDERFLPYDRSELAMALATVEYEAGTSHKKRIRTLLRKSLIDPTENAVAQAEWLSMKDASLHEFNVDLSNIPCIFEARAKEAVSTGKWETALSNATLWFVDQPFSSRPAIMVSYIANTILDDHEKAIKIGEMAIKSNPNDPLLLNNLAFSLAMTNNLQRAKIVLRRARKQTLEEPGLAIAITATEGLIAFRSGDCDLGHMLYKDAIAEANAKNLRRESGTASIYLVGEELRAGLLMADKALEKILAIEKQTNDPLATRIAKRMISSLVGQVITKM